MESLLEQFVFSLTDSRKKFYGVVTGKVINTLDPMMLGRVQVQLPFIDDLDLSPWARIASPMAGIAHGAYFIPNPGDEVLVAFEHGELNSPYILGSLWNATTPPPLPSPIPQFRMLKTPVGNQIMFTEAPPTITINTPQGQTIFMSPAGIQIQTGANMINMTPDGVTIAGATVNVTATTAINLTAPTVSVNSTKTDLLSSGACNVAAPMVKIN